MYTIVNEERTYGVEIEFFGASTIKLIEALKKRGIETNFMGYTHRVTTQWKIVTDSSVANEGLELVSPILKGTDGIEQLAKVCEALEEVGAKVNKTCGLHVHLDAMDLDIQQWKNILVFYHNYQRSINNMLPKSRRDNGYCRDYDESELRTIAKLKTLSDLKDFAEWRMTRYKVININSFLRHGTIEFRQHSGTIEFEKIYHWIQFCMATIEKGKQVKVLDINKVEDETKEFEALLRHIRKSGATLNDIKYYRTRKEQLAECI